MENLIAPFDRDHRILLETRIKPLEMFLNESPLKLLESAANFTNVIRS
jgi:hypothetical protein